MADEDGPAYPLPVLCNSCGRALANVGEWCCGRFTSPADVTVAATAVGPPPPEATSVPGDIAADLAVLMAKTEAAANRREDSWTRGVRIIVAEAVIAAGWVPPAEANQRELHHFEVEQDNAALKARLAEVLAIHREWGETDADDIDQQVLWERIGRALTREEASNG